MARPVAWLVWRPNRWPVIFNMSGLGSLLQTNAHQWLAAVRKMYCVFR